jgi:hypothetical protein
MVKVKVLGLMAGSRSYECQVVGIADKVRLSSKSLANVDAPASHQGPNSTTTVTYQSGDAVDTEESESDEVVEDDAVDAVANDLSILKAKDWRLESDFEDSLASQHPNIIPDSLGELRVRIAMAACDIFFTLFSMALVEAAFPSWRGKRQANHKRCQKYK